MNANLPFLTAYDPAGTSEGTLDPLGLYQIADQLAVLLVPAVRERMVRIRLLTAMAVGALVTEGMGRPGEARDADPYLVWEWLVVESLIRSEEAEVTSLGVPGTNVTRRAIERYGYLDARSYLKTPRVFGFNGVYKRLATYIGVVNVNLGPGRNAEGLVDAWARDLGYRGLGGAKPVIDRWSDAVRRSLAMDPPRTNPRFSKDEWSILANAFTPARRNGRCEKKFLLDLLLSEGENRLNALPDIWQVQDSIDDSVGEEKLHNLLGRRCPQYLPLLQAIQTYEKFARALQDAFDILRIEAAQHGARGYAVPAIAENAAFKKSVSGLDRLFASAFSSLSEISGTIQGLFQERFGCFAEPSPAEVIATRLCTHHERVQQGKSAEGKRAWFDRIGPDRIYIRHAYRIPAREPEPDRYVHFYRGVPIRRFYKDLT